MPAERARRRRACWRAGWWIVLRILRQMRSVASTSRRPGRGRWTATVPSVWHTPSSLSRRRAAVGEPTAVIFDLDDTLYAERRFVLSGYAAVAAAVSSETGMPSRVLYRFLVRRFRS